MVDEAHNYKNGLVVSKMSRVSGVQTTPAKKSEDILMKTQFLNENYGEKNIIFATGTPIITGYLGHKCRFYVVYAEHHHRIMWCCSAFSVFG